jgi:hypothetical protein
VGAAPVIFNSVQIDIDTATGRAVGLARLSKVVDE